MNLTLDVIGKREDGFHELRSIFQTISLGDTIEIDCQPARQTRLTIDCVPEIPDNIILRAADAVLQQLKRRAEIRVRLMKRIPMGGGVGGGSSNAAEVLRPMAAQLGGDVPSFYD